MVKPSGPRIVLLKKGEHGCLAAIGKETLDETGGGSFNLNQMGAAMAGAG